MSIDFGWNEYIDKTGTPCAYCGEPSTHTLAIEPDQTRNHELVKRGKRVGVCDAHNRQLDAEPAPALSFRRRKAKDVEQLGMDVGDGRHTGSRNAIHGDEAA